jgi:hypothetical protein
MQKTKTQTQTKSKPLQTSTNPRNYSKRFVAAAASTVSTSRAPSFILPKYPTPEQRANWGIAAATTTTTTTTNNNNNNTNTTHVIRPKSTRRRKASTNFSKRKGKYTGYRLVLRTALSFVVAQSPSDAYCLPDTLSTVVSAICMAHSIPQPPQGKHGKDIVTYFRNTLAPHGEWVSMEYAESFLNQEGFAVRMVEYSDRHSKLALLRRTSGFYVAICDISTGTKTTATHALSYLAAARQLTDNVDTEIFELDQDDVRALHSHPNKAKKRAAFVFTQRLGGLDNIKLQAWYEVFPMVEAAHQGHVGTDCG